MSLKVNSIEFHTSCEVDGLDYVKNYNTEYLVRNGVNIINDDQMKEFAKCQVENFKDIIEDVTDNTTIFKTLYESLINKHLQFLADGALNNVYEVSINNKKYILRILNNRDYAEAEYQGAFIQNIFNDCANIPKIYALGLINSRVFQLMEYGGEKELFSIIGAKNYNLIKKTAINYIRQIAQSVECMHSKNIIHRDIKCENIMIKKNNDIESLYLIDFGTANIHPNYQVGYIPHTPHCMPYVSKEKTEIWDKEFKGDNELLMKRLKEYDIFALAVIIMAFLDNTQFKKYWSYDFDDKRLYAYRYIPSSHKDDKLAKLHEFAKNVFNYNRHELPPIYNSQHDFEIIVNDNHTVQKLLDILNEEDQTIASRIKSFFTKKSKKGGKKRKSKNIHSNMRKTRKRKTKSKRKGKK